MSDDESRVRRPMPTKSHGRLSIAASLKPRELVTERPVLKRAWTAKVITLFPDAFPGVLGESLTGKALEQGVWQLHPIDLRAFGKGKHRDVDDTPSGGGAGMVIRADVLGEALETALPKDRARWPVVYLSPRGTPFTQAKAQAWAEGDGITMICGRFEGIDQRVIDHYDIEEVSLGDFVLTGGEIAAQAMLDATVRLRADVLGNAASTEDESFSSGLLEHPQYTRPAEWKGRKIPEVLTSGHHGKIADWRQAEAEQLTERQRPDLWTTYCAEKEGRKPS